MIDNARNKLMLAEALRTLEDLVGSAQVGNYTGTYGVRVCVVDGSIKSIEDDSNRVRRRILTEASNVEAKAE
jgi:hypothetical protein